MKADEALWQRLSELIASQRRAILTFDRDRLLELNEQLDRCVTELTSDQACRRHDLRPLAARVRVEGELNAEMLRDLLACVDDCLQALGGGVTYGPSGARGRPDRQGLQLDTEV